MGQRAAERAADPAAVPGLLLTALSGTSASVVAAARGEPTAESWARHEALAAAACRAAVRLGEPEAAAAALGPPLAQLCEAEGDGAGCAPRPTYGLLSLTLSLATALPAEAAEHGAGQQQQRRHGLPPSLAALRLPLLALRFAAACQARAPGSGLPIVQRAAQLAARLVAVAPELLPGLLQAAVSSVEQAGSDAGSSEGRTSTLAAVLPVLLEMAAAEELQPALMTQERLLRRALDACNCAAAATRGAADCMQQLLQLRAVCASACGWDPNA